MLSPINQFLTSQMDSDIKENPCISPDFCLNWEKLKSSIEAGDSSDMQKVNSLLSMETWILIENEDGDHAWELTAKVDDSN